MNPSQKNKQPVDWVPKDRAEIVNNETYWCATDDANVVMLSGAFIKHECIWKDIVAVCRIETPDPYVPKKQKRRREFMINPRLTPAIDGSLADANSEDLVHTCEVLTSDVPPEIANALVKAMRITLRVSPDISRRDVQHWITTLDRLWQAEKDRRHS